jgi:CubicO group peptidase (beta-lactamase class C family)
MSREAVEARLGATLDRVRVKLAIPGISATVIFPDGTSWSGASGLAIVATKAPVSPETTFAFASMSKTFLSAVILELVGEGRLKLSDSAAALLPAGLPITLDRRITIGMLLDHTSGLADYFLNPKIDAALRRAPARVWTAADALRFVGKRLSPPGKAWHYSNTNYLLLGLIAERVTGRPLATEIRDRLLDPLGLSSIWYQAVEDRRPTLAHGYRFNGTKATARPIDLADGTGVAPFRSVVTAAGGAGSLAGTSVDLARWARALYSGDVLGPVGTGLLLSDFNKTTGYLPGVSYGFGVQALSIDGHISLGHSGRLLGFQGAVRHFSVDGFTIAVLTNQSRADPGAVVRSLLRVVAPPPPPAPAPSGSPGPSGSSQPSASTSANPG